MEKLKHLGVWITEAAITGVPMIPLFIFVTSFIKHEGEFTYVLPFVLFYAFSKMGEFTLGIFGKVNNPYRLAKISGWLVIIGAVTILFGSFHIAFYDIGAILIGFGTSIFGTMYRTVKGELAAEHKFNYPHANAVGFAIMTVLSFVILGQMGRLETVIIAMYVVMTIAALLTVQSFEVDSDKRHARIFVPNTGRWQDGIPALLMLLIAFFVRLFKQTAGPVDIIIVVLLSAIILIIVAAHSKYTTKQVFEYRGVYVNEVLIMCVLFFVFKFIAQGDITGVIMINGFQFLGQFIAILIGARIIAALHKHDLSVPNLCVICMLGLLVLFAIPTYVTGVIAMTLIGFVSQIGDQSIHTIFGRNTELSRVDVGLSSQKTIGTGIVAGQTILVIVMAIVSFIMLHNDTIAMSAYAFHMNIEGVSTVFLITRIACAVVVALQGIAMLIYAKCKTGTVLHWYGPQKVVKNS
ncbi:hypothetical protein D2E26_0475 [Bifidobacterium dolichotidis]|uniref:Uncharacterized protein n=1 Tax=Bifidobacterium dolichotidis TaxID=2306976 RepID=A0A430FSP6_9BIFI|nr:hypothetical protein [Bifidobacterium dolichotidis]RSX55912.1 hypothetical protein D2E26_0475 [Bifidobacterium dolichotidis]